MRQISETKKERERESCFYNYPKHSSGLAEKYTANANRKITNFVLLSLYCVRVRASINCNNDDDDDDDDYKNSRNNATRALTPIIMRCVYRLIFSKIAAMPAALSKTRKKKKKLQTYTFVCR
jgi:hypothetical protein